MVNSMTGYGKGEATFQGRTITVELRAVNNRYFDSAVRIPRLYLFMEDQIKSTLQRHISRGKVDVFVSLEGSEGSPVEISINRPLADGYYKAYAQLAQTYQLENDLTLSALAKLPEVLVLEKSKEDVQAVGEQILSVLALALQEFSAMRQREGSQLKEDILSHSHQVHTLLTHIEERSPHTVQEYRQKLEARMAEILENTQIDPSHILTEAALFADKVAVDEETVRLHSHLLQLREMLEQGGAVGRKLDFLIQEFNREANTIGSKCNDIQICRWVVDMKAEIEKIREQTQNIE